MHDNLRIEYRPTESLTPRARNPRTHGKKQIRQIAESIRTFGFTNPILVDAVGEVLAGHGRLQAAELLGIKEVPTVRLDEMTEAQKRAYVIADNKLAENAGWDTDLLAIELQYLVELDTDLDATITGFETPEIDLLIESLTPGEDDPAADEMPAVDPEAPQVSRSGDLWCLRQHRLLVADCLDPESFDRLMAGQQAEMVLIDPPYNVPIDGNVCGLGAIKHRDFVMAAGEMSEAEFAGFLETAFRNLAANSVDGSIHYVFMDWRHIGEPLKAARKVYSELKNLCVWSKDNAGMGTFYRSQHELVFVFKKGTAPHINNFELGQHGRHRSNVWSYPGVNTLRPGRLDELRMHPTVKPVALVADAIMDCSHRSGIILDCFAGSGTTIIAAEKTGRRAYAIEIDPGYVDTAIRRWQAYTGESAMDAASRSTFEAISKQRAGAAPYSNGQGSGPDHAGEVPDVR